jgi:hypothetical protein
VRSLEVAGSAASETRNIAITLLRCAERGSNNEMPEDEGSEVLMTALAIVSTISVFVCAALIAYLVWVEW